MEAIYYTDKKQSNDFLSVLESNQIGKFELVTTNPVFIILGFPSYFIHIFEVTAIEMEKDSSDFIFRVASEVFANPAMYLVVTNNPNSLGDFSEFLKNRSIDHLVDLET